MEIIMKPCVITIGREFCSGGAEIGKKVAEYFDIPYYDKSILDEAGKLLGMHEDDVKKHDERKDHYWDMPGYRYGMYVDDPSLLLPPGMRLAQAQFDLMRRYAQEGPCVIVGRCADYILKDYPRAVHVFIYADIEKRVERAMRLYGITDPQARKLIKKTDKVRSAYYKNYTKSEWGAPGHYDLRIDAGRIGIRAAVDEIIEFVRTERWEE